MDGNRAMNSEFENMSEQDMEQQEKTVWVDQGWPKVKTTVTLIIELAKMMETTPILLHNWLINNEERLKNDAANEIKNAYLQGINYAEGINTADNTNNPEVENEWFDKNYEQSEQ